MARGRVAEYKEEMPPPAVTALRAARLHPYGPLAGLLLVAILAAGCRSASSPTPPDGPPRAVADWFMDRQYVEARQSVSVLATVGPAREKVQAEADAVERLRGGGGVPSEMRAQRVYYEHAGGGDREGEGGDLEEHVYHLRVDNPAMPLQKEIVLALVEEEGRWRIFSIRERDLPAEPEGGGTQ